MNKKSLTAATAIGIAGLLQACAPQQIATMDYECEIVQIPACTGNPPSININVNSKNIAPPNYCAGPGETITFKVTPNNAPIRSVAVVPKDPADIWMIGTNDPDANEFTVVTPSSSDEYGYTVIFANGDCIDPRITVE